MMPPRDAVLQIVTESARAALDTTEILRIAPTITLQELVRAIAGNATQALAGELGPLLQPAITTAIRAALHDRRTDYVQDVLDLGLEVGIAHRVACAITEALGGGAD